MGFNRNGLSGNERRPQGEYLAGTGTAAEEAALGRAVQVADSGDFRRQFQGALAAPVENLDLYYDNFQALKNINLKMQANEIMSTAQLQSRELKKAAIPMRSASRRFCRIAQSCVMARNMDSTKKGVRRKRNLRKLLKK